MLIMTFFKHTKRHRRIVHLQDQGIILSELYFSREIIDFRIFQFAWDNKRDKKYRVPVSTHSSHFSNLFLGHAMSLL